MDRPQKSKRHVVILGAGASVAAFPVGDASSKKLPTMDNLIEMLELEPLISAEFDSHNKNFEEIYSSLFNENSDSPVLNEIEEKIYTYFADLKLPDTPTIYDHLLMSLRPKDYIATFNWDPFLFDAWKRNKEKFPVPEIVHLHGNVRVAHCQKHPCYGEHGMICPECKNDLIPTKLLYPIETKNYTDDYFIKTEWEVLKKAISQAMTITIFGYGAPKTDKDAVDLLSNAWDKDKRFIERIEVIDIKTKEELWENWDDFIIRQYFDCINDFYDSRLARYPRRTCEALLQQTVYGQFVEYNPIPRDDSFKGLIEWLSPMLEAEKKLGSL